MANNDLKAWESYDALEETIRRDTKATAEALHLNDKTVRRYKCSPASDDNPTGTGERNPLDRLKIIIETIEKIDPKRAYVPIKWLCAQFDFMPPVKLPDFKGSDEELLKALLRHNKEFGETCKEISSALDDGTITAKEYERIYREFTEDIEAGFAIMMRLNEKVEK